MQNPMRNYWLTRTIQRFISTLLANGYESEILRSFTFTLPLCSYVEGVTPHYDPLMASDLASRDYILPSRSCLALKVYMLTAAVIVYAVVVAVAVVLCGDQGQGRCHGYLTKGGTDQTW